jgi:hypothetical protein
VNTVDARQDLIDFFCSDGHEELQAQAAYIADVCAASQG